MKRSLRRPTVVQTSPSRLGRYVTTTTAGEQVRAFLPPTLPPDPAVDLGRLQRRLERASQALGRLDGLTRLCRIPNLHLSLRAQGGGALVADRGHAVVLVRSPLVRGGGDAGRPLGRRDRGLELRRGPGASASGASAATCRSASGCCASFTRSCCVTGAGPTRCRASFGARQNWIGGTRPGNAAFVPPPPEYLHGMPRSARTVSSPRRRKSSRAGKGGDGARPVRDDPPFSGRQRSDRPPSHHPHVVQRRPDGGAAALPQPFPEKASDAILRAAARGSAARRLGGLVGVLPRGSRGDRHPGSVLSQDSARALLGQDRKVLGDVGRGAGTALQVHDWFQQHPIGTIASVSKGTGLTKPPVSRAIDCMVERGILVETTGRQRDRIFAYRRYLDLLAEGTEPLPRS